ncbi:hypothetical protein BDW74DRAFT_183042 [Aspergillus multicolor]|uniref:uncharacterized protein n=1 Tax=Aspergillus multicolor TaxID=41759 RepID=UPI003CCD66A5
MTVNENTPLLREPCAPSRRRAIFSPESRILVAGFIISVALSFTQVPILYVFRLMSCAEYYRHSTSPETCNLNGIDSATAAQVSILGLSTAFCGVLNLFFAGWQIKRLGPRAALVIQTAFPALRVAIQVLGVTVGFKEGIFIVQASQLITLVGGQSGYLLVLNTAAGEVVSVSERTGMFGMLQGSVMLGTSIGYLLGGIVGDAFGIRRPFEIATGLFVLSSLYSARFVPYIDPMSLQGDGNTTTGGKSGGIWNALTGGLNVLSPRKLLLPNGTITRHYGITLLALGVFMGVLATGFAPILIQMYATAVFAFQPTENGYLMATNSLIRGIFLILFFPRIITAGRKWFSKPLQENDINDSVSAKGLPTDPEDFAPPSVLADQEAAKPLPPAKEETGQAFDLFFLRWSLLVDGLATTYTAFATVGWHIYIAGFLLPLASGSAPAAKGVITEMCRPTERADALQAMTLVENVAMLSTLGLFGLIFSAFADVGRAYLTFYCNAAVAFAAVGILVLARFPPREGNLDKGDDANE